VVACCASLLGRSVHAQSTGCGGGQREGFLHAGTYPDIAGCAGAWTVPGVSLFAPAAIRMDAKALTSSAVADG